MMKIIKYKVEPRKKFGKKTGKYRIEKVKCGNPCKDFIMYGCGVCPPSCHQPAEYYEKH